MTSRSRRGAAWLAVALLATAAACKSKPAGDAAGAGPAAGSAAAPAAGSAAPPAAGSAAARAAGSGAPPAAGSAAPPAAGSAAAAAPPADGKPPDLCARELLEAQVAALAGNQTDALRAMFAAGAIALVPDARAVDPSFDLIARLAQAMPNARLAGAKLGKVAVGSTAAAIWLAADIAIPASAGPAHHLRAVELLDGAQGWKIAAASFAPAAKPRRSAAAAPAVPAPTEAGPLSALLAAPTQLAQTLPEDDDSSVVVLGPEASERGDGLVDAKLLAYKLGKRKLALAGGKAHEVRTAGWGYAIGNVDQLAASGDPQRLTALVIALPAASGGWSTVAAVYNAL